MKGNIYDYKFIIYDNSFEDNPLDSVYAIGALGYNIPEANEIAKYVQGVKERRYARQKVLKELLKRHAEKFGYVLRRYNTKTRRLNNVGGTLTKNREDFIRQSVGAGFINRAGQFVKYDDSRNTELYGEEDDLFGAEYDADRIEDVLARHYLTHSEAIGEVLRNTADIEIAPNTFKNIVGRVPDADTAIPATVLPHFSHFRFHFGSLLVSFSSQ